MKSRKIRILLADDNPDIRSALALLLETRLPVQVVAEADTMENLLAGVKLSRPELILLDWELPGLPRENRVAGLRSAYASVKVVVTSSRPEVAHQALAAQADACVCTCEQPELVIQVIRDLMKC